MPLETARNDRRVRVGQSAKRSEVISVFRSDLHAFRVGASTTRGRSVTESASEESRDSKSEYRQQDVNAILKR